MTDYVHQKRFAAFGTRLRRLSERLDREVEAVYREHGVVFEPRWFAVVTVLDERGAVSVGELAAVLGVSHAAVSQVRGGLIDAGLVAGRADPDDRRRQILALTPKGRREIARLKPLWAAIAASVEALCAEAAPGLIDMFTRIEDAMAEKPVPHRVAELLHTPPKMKKEKSHG
ncbi:MAG TPA: MarR family winged helix-turn-helix transcriptional regulator [Rhizomicrobium sp.]